MICRTCNKFSADYRGECKVCGYKHRNKDKIDAVLSREYWSKDELETVMYHMLYATFEVVNDIVPFLNNKSLDDLVHLLEFDMPIRGKVKNQIRLECFSCGKELIRPLKHYYQERVYCDFKCRDRYKTQFLSGENSVFYKRIHTCCTNCGKPIDVTPFDYNKINSFGENNNFCSQECCWEYRGKYYIGERGPMYRYQYTDEQLNKLKVRATEMIARGAFPQTLTEPHRKINALLDDCKIKYTNEYLCKYHSVDIHLTDFNLFIEIMGDYWHGNPLKYSYKDLSAIQLKDVKQDKSKHTYVNKCYDIEILYLWEHDIKNNIELCLKLIKLYIENNGKIENYHSFNYHLDKQNLVLNQNLIYPYFYNTESLSTAG